MYHFHIDIEAPDGLDDLDPYLETCNFPLQAILSGYNGKTIRRCSQDDEIAWTMNANATSLVSLYGHVRANLARTEELLTELSTVLASAGFPHLLKIADANGEEAGISSFLWSAEHQNTKTRFSPDRFV